MCEFIVMIYNLNAKDFVWIYCYDLQTTTYQKLWVKDGGESQIEQSELRSLMVYTVENF